MKRFLQYAPFLLALFLISCQGSRKSSSSTDDGQIEIVFLHINDVYEIAPLEGGKTGGMARVATLRQQLKNQNKNTLTILAGDFLNPSVIGTLYYESKRVKGRQMIEAMNACGVDLVTFGNHEFDLKEKELQERLNESESQWFSSNVLQRSPNSVSPFKKIKNGKAEPFPDTWIWEVEDADGTKIKVGFFGVTLDSNPQDYVLYKDYKAEARKAIKRLSKKVDLIIGITHLEIDQDLELAKLVPEVPLLMGGHDHHHMEHHVGPVTVAKADANARTAYIHRLVFNKKTKKAQLKSELKALDETVALDSVTNAVVEKWNQIAIKTFKLEGFDPYRVIAKLDTPLDGKESSIRHKQTNLGELITKSMSANAKQQNDGSILNSGSIRIDDELAGNLTQYDLIRAMPYGGGIAEIKINGKILKEVLDEGEAKKGRGAYLQRDKIDFDANTQQWMISGKALQTDKDYLIVVNDFLLRGLDIKALKRDNEGITVTKEPDPKDKTDRRNDIRLVVVDYLEGSK